MSNVIQIRAHDKFQRYEAVASAAVSPGKLVERESTGKVKPQSAVGIKVEVAVALEDSYQGNGVTTDYDSGDLVQFNTQMPGNIVQLRLANGESVVKGDKLVSAGSGEVKKMTEDSSTTVDEEVPLAIADAVLDFSDSSGADPSSNLLRSIIL